MDWDYYCLVFGLALTILNYVFNNPLSYTDPSGFETKKKAASSAAKTGSTQLTETVSATETSSQDHTEGGQSGTSDQSTGDEWTGGAMVKGNDAATGSGDAAQAANSEKTGSTANAADQNGYGSGEGTGSQHTGDKQKSFEQNGEGTTAKEHALGERYNTKKAQEYRKGLDMRVFAVEGARLTIFPSKSKRKVVELNNGDTYDPSMSLYVTVTYKNSDAGQAFEAKSRGTSGGDFTATAEYSTKSNSSKVFETGPLLMGGTDVTRYGGDLGVIQDTLQRQL